MREVAAALIRGDWTRSAEAEVQREKDVHVFIAITRLPILF